MSRKPLSSTKTRWAPRRAAFFYPRPVFPLPASDGGFVPLDGSALRLLAAPAERRQHLPDVRRVIANPELVANQFGHPRERPELRAIPGVRGALAQQCHQPPSLGRGARPSPRGVSSRFSLAPPEPPKPPAKRRASEARLAEQLDQQPPVVCLSVVSRPGPRRQPGPDGGHHGLERLRLRQPADDMEPQVARIQILGASRTILVHTVADAGRARVGCDRQVMR